MLVFDAPIYNEDRHFGNFGLLRDNHSGKIISPAPRFDQGQPLLFFAGQDDLESLANLKEYAKLHSTPADAEIPLSPASRPEPSGRAFVLFGAGAGGAGAGTFSASHPVKKGGTS